MGADLSILRRQGGGDPSTSTAAASAPSASASALERRVAAHQTHVRRLDQILRLLSNYQVEPNVVDTKVREAIEGYVARSEVALERSSSASAGGGAAGGKRGRSRRSSNDDDGDDDESFYSAEEEEEDENEDDEDEDEGFDDIDAFYANVPGLDRSEAAGIGQLSSHGGGGGFRGAGGVCDAADG